MPVLRGGITADEFATLDIYFEEQEPQIPEKPVGVSSKVMGIIGRFQKGSPNELITVVGERQFKEKCGQFLDEYPGSKAAWAAFQRGVKKLVLVPVQGAGASQASIILQDRASTPQDTIEIKKKDPNKLGNDCTVEVKDGSAAGTFTLVLSGPGIKTETYADLKTPQEAVAAINKLSPEFVAIDKNSSTPAPDNIPAVQEPTKLTGGSDGGTPTATHYKGSTDSSTGKKTGLELMKTSVEVTDVVTDVYVSDIMNEALIGAAEAMNWFTYLPQAQGTSVSAAILKRGEYNTEFAHLTLGHAKSKQMGWYVPAAVYDCIAHVLSLPQDGTAGFYFSDIESLDVPISDDDVELLTKNNVVCMGQMLNEKREMVYGMKSDYTLSTDPRYRQTYRRRVTSLIEKDYYIIMVPFRSKHISKGMLRDAMLVTRKYFDDAKTAELIQNYDVVFTPPEQIGNIDELIEDLTVDLYNIADKIRIRILSAANAIE
jgi:hypothetical protein